MTSLSNIVDLDGNGLVEHNEFIIWMRKMLELLCPDADLSEAEVEELIESDWRQDSKGRTGINKPKFMACWFQLTGSQLISLINQV